MPKYLVEGNYTAEAFKGLQKNKATGRRAAAVKAIKALGGKLDCLYYAFGDNDFVAICDMPDNVSIAALLTTMAASGLVRTKTTALLTIEEMDAALKRQAKYRAPGQ